MQNIVLLTPISSKEEVIDKRGQCLNIGWIGISYKTYELEKSWYEYTQLNNCHL